MSKFYSHLNNPTPTLTPEDQALEGGFVRFVLTNGHEIDAHADTLDEDDTAIYGTTLGGLNFALPIANLMYVVEGV